MIYGMYMNIIISISGEKAKLCPDGVIAYTNNTPLKKNVAKTTKSYIAIDFIVAFFSRDVSNRMFFLPRYEMIL